MSNCKAKTEVYARVCGFYRPVQSWNPGKRAEFHARKPYVVTNKTPKTLIHSDTKRKDKSS